MENPFTTLETYFTRIEELLLELLSFYKKGGNSAVQPKETIFNVYEAAEFLKLTPSTIYSLVSKNELPVMKRNRRLYFLKSDLLNYLKQGYLTTSAKARGPDLE